MHSLTKCGDWNKKGKRIKLFKHCLHKMYFNICRRVQHDAFQRSKGFYKVERSFIKINYVITVNDLLLFHVNMVNYHKSGALFLPHTHIQETPFIYTWTVIKQILFNDSSENALLQPVFNKDCSRKHVFVLYFVAFYLLQKCDIVNKGKKGVATLGHVFLFSWNRPRANGPVT